MNFVSIQATNFLSFKELNYDFVSHPVLIQGENLTEIESQESNGSGKTSIQCAIEYALMSATSRKVKDSELIFWGEKEADIILKINCNIREEILIIYRKVFLKGSSKLELIKIKNGEEIPVNFSTVLDGNKYILEWLDLSKEDIQNFFIVNKERYSSFFSSPNIKKIELISRFSNFDKINGIDKLVQEDVNILEKEIKDLEISKASIQGIIDDSKVDLEKLINKDFNVFKKDKIEKQNYEIKKLEYAIDEKINLRKKLEKEDGELLRELMDINKKGDEIQLKISNLNKISFKDNYDEIDQRIEIINLNKQNKLKDKLNIKNSIDEISEIIDGINRNINNSVKCPKCHYEFVLNNFDIDLDKEKEELKNADKIYKLAKIKFDNVKKLLIELDNSFNKIDQEKNEIIKKENDINKQIRELKYKLNEITKEIDRINENLRINKSDFEKSLDDEKLLNLKINSIKEQIKIIENQSNNFEEKNKLKEKIRINSIENNKIDFKLKYKENELYNISQWIFNFKKFYGYLANKSLKILQGYANKYLKDLDSDLQIKWEGFKMKSDGNLTEKITPYILRSGDIRDFWSFSGGERARLDFVMILTIQGIINSSHKFGGLDFISIDEVFEGLDGLGLGKMMNSLKKLEKTILITTHVTDRNVHENILLIKKVNGISTLN